MESRFRPFVGGDLMARLKSGLDYFPFEVSFFSDKKIKRLRAKYGNDGVMVYIYLLCEVYKNGYYIDYDDDLILDISDELNISENATMQIMNYLLSRSLFDDTLAKSVKVLTAKSIQLRYQEAVEKRAKKRDSKCIEVEAKFWVLNEEETRSFIKVRPVSETPRKKSLFPGNNSIIPGKNTTKESKVKKSKLKESKGEESAPHFSSDGCAFLSDRSYNALVSEYGADVVDDYLERAGSWAVKKRIQLGECESTIRKWIGQDGVKPVDRSVDKYKCVINQFEIPEG